MTNRHILILPSGYPSVHAPVLGIFFKLQAQALHKSGHKVGVIYPDFRSLRTFTFSSLLQNRFQHCNSDEEGIPVFRYNAWNVLSAKLRLKLQCKATLKLVNNYIRKYGKPDIIHAHCVDWAGIAATMLSEEHGIPFVITEHSSAFANNLILPWQKTLIRKAYNSSSANIAVSRNLADLTADYRGCKDMIVIPNMVDTGFLCLPAQNREMKPFTFLLVALLTENKGISFLVEAFACEFAGNRDYVLEIGGDGSQMHALKTLAESLGVADQVIFLGRLDQQGVRDAMWRANTFVLPSLYETFGVVLIEAMSTGLPVIATRCGGPEEVMSGNKRKNGMLVPSADSEELSHAMRYIANNIDKYDPTAIRNSIVDDFSQSAVSYKISSVYDSIL